MRIVLQWRRIKDDEILEQEEIENSSRSVVSLLFIDASCQSVDGAATNKLSIESSEDNTQNESENTQNEDDNANDQLKCQGTDGVDQNSTNENSFDSQSDSDLVLASSHADGTVRFWTLEVIGRR